jgi:hypothetical protein
VDQALAVRLGEPAVSVRLTFDISEAQALALAQFLKRVGWSEMRANAVDTTEAYVIRAVFEELRKELAHVGYAPR